MESILSIIESLPETLCIAIVGLASVLASILPPTDKKGLFWVAYRAFYNILQIVAFNIGYARNKK